MLEKSFLTRLLVEQLKNMGLKVIYVVKGGPVINDATMEDVRNFKH